MIRPNEHVLEFVDDYLHEVLSPADTEIVEHHCETCRVCKVALEEAEKRLQALKTVPATEAPERLIQQAVENIEMHETKHNRFRKYYTRTVLLATAASVLIIGLVNLYYYQLSATPYDLRLLGQESLLSGSNASLRVTVLDQRTGKPVDGVPVEIALYNPNNKTEVQLVSFTTDQRGAASPRFDLPDWENGEYQLRVTARPGGAPEVLTEPIQLKRSWKLMLSTDKPVYQPGQTIHVRSLALRRPDLKPVTGQGVIFTITDPKGNVIFKHSDHASKYGISSADCRLATEILEGAYEIECLVGDTSSQKTVEVQKYVLPKFKVAVTLDKPFYGPGEPVSGTVQADYFFGKPVAGGEVRIEARATDVASFEIASITEKTDDKGKASFRFVLPQRLIGREQDAGNARFMLVATVTDTAGQTHSKGTSRIVTEYPIQLDVIPESGTLIQGLANKIYVFTTYADGRPAKTRVVAHGVEEEVETGELGVASLEITPHSDELSLTVKATDAEGLIGRRHVQLACGKFDGDFLIRPDKAVYDGGQTMTVTALGGGVEPVFLDFIKDGQTILTQSIEMADGKGQYEFDLPPELFGTIQLCAYRFRGHGLAVRKTRMIYVRQAKGLTIKATLEEQYRPGTKATLKLALTDDQDNPVPGAISLAAVDEAVFSVLAQQAGMEKTFFLLEQELLQPVYTIYPGWNPELFSELPIGQRNQFEQAVFSKTANSIAGANALPAAFFGPRGGQNAGPGQPEEAMVDAPALQPVAAAAMPGETPFTLAVASYADKFARVKRQRRAGLWGVTIAWFSLLGVSVLTGIATFAMFQPKAFLITAGICAVLSCCGGVPVALLATFYTVARSQKADFAEAPLGLDVAMERAWGGAEADIAPSDEAMPALEPAAQPSPDTQQAAPPRVRQWFPETLLWKPELVTDDHGVCELDVPLADSITTWRISTSAVSGEGQLGAAQFPLKVFQPFFVDFDLPVALTRNDEVSVPVVVYNYLDKPQTVELELKDADWFQRLDGDNEDQGGQQSQAGDAVLKLDLAPEEVRSLSFPLKILKVGNHQLEVAAIGSGVSDAIRREIEVVPDGRRVEQIASGTLSQPAEMAMSVPEDAIEGSVRAIVKLYPSSFSQLVEGLDAIFQMPGGCFEQTSSTTYPNVLALDYLRRTKKSVPQVEAKAKQYIHAGYQRLVSFEVQGGGFDWFGNPPANRTLTAYGLMEFEDMAQVHDVDPRLIDRTRQWLLRQRGRDGSWSNEAGMLDDGLASSVNRGGNLDLAATAYVAWAVFGGGTAKNQAGRTLDYLLAHRPDSIEDPYLLAIVTMAIAGIDKNNSKLGSYVARLDALKKTSEDGKQSWWEQPAGGRTTFYGSGRSGSIVTTATAALAMLRTGQYPGTARGALTWLIEQKDPNGTWHSTQATVLSLKALLAGTGAALGGEQERKIDVALGGEVVQKFVIPKDQGDVMQQFDLSQMLRPGNDYQLTLTEHTDTAVGYQVTFRYHVEETTSTEAKPADALSIDVTYDRERLAVDETVAAVATVTNNMGQVAPMVIVDLPIPGGFAIDPGELDELKGSQKIAKYQITARQAIVYLRQLQPGQSLELRYRLKATMPVKVAVPDAQVYEYYNPDNKAGGGATRLEAAIEA